MTMAEPIANLNYVDCHDFNAVQIGKMQMNMSRRDYLISTAAMTASTVSGGLVQSAFAEESRRVKPKPVAVVATVHQKGRHGELFIEKILEGWNQDGGPGPALKLASLYIDQFPREDKSRKYAAKYNVPLFKTIDEAVSIGSDTIPVEGVISVGEHGSYPYNEKGQHLYPRRRFFEEIAAAMEKRGRVVPVFNDKHFGPVWEDAKWMYDRAQELKMPLMAGSSLPVSYRKPDLSIPLDSPIEAAVGVGYSGLDIYGIHTLECFQALVERRRGGETGIKWVQCLQGPAMWKALDDGLVRQDLLDAALAVTPKGSEKELRKLKHAWNALFLFQYNDGLLGAVFMLQGYAAGISAAVKITGKPEPLATHFEERLHPKHPHFTYLLKAIEQFVHRGKAVYPVERTLLTSGLLDRLLTSRYEDSAKLETPELAIRYEPVDYPHAPRPALNAAPA